MEEGQKISNLLVQWRGFTRPNQAQKKEYLKLASVKEILFGPLRGVTDVEN